MTTVPVAAGALTQEFLDAHQGPDVRIELAPGTTHVDGPLFFKGQTLACPEGIIVPPDPTSPCGT